MTKVYTNTYGRPSQDELDDATGLIDPLLHGLLSIATPHKHEKFLDRYLPKGCVIDKMGNRIYNIGKLQDHGTIFSCHMDTVHATPINLVPVISKNKFVYAEDVTGSPAVLGADDRLGVFIMIRMMEQKIPGRYIFHVGEEHGGIGSKYIAKETPQQLKGAKRAIAFDRANYGDIIRSQLSQTCCSDEFVKALGDALNITMPPHQKFGPNTGSFTDTASYMYHIPECTNLSVGYFNQHGVSEHFDYVWLQNILLPTIMKMEWHKLPVHRDHEAALKKELEWRNRPVYSHSSSHSQWPKKPEQAKTPLPANVQKKSDKKEEVNPNALPYKDVTFNTPLFQIPNIRAYQILPDGYEADGVELGIKAALHKRLEVAGSYAFMHDVFCVMRNFKMVIAEMNKASTRYNDMVDKHKKEVAAICDKNAEEILKRDNEIIAQKAVIEDLRMRLKEVTAKPVTPTVH